VIRRDDPVEFIALIDREQCRASGWPPTSFRFLGLTQQCQRAATGHSAQQIDALSQGASGTRALKQRKDMLTIFRFWLAKVMTAAANTQIIAI